MGLTVIVWLTISERPREEHDMELNVAQELADLRGMTPAELRVKYAAAFGEESRSGVMVHRVFVWLFLVVSRRG